MDPCTLGYRPITENEVYIECEDEFDEIDEDAPFNVIHVKQKRTHLIINNSIEGSDRSNQIFVFAFVSKAAKDSPNTKDIIITDSKEEPTGKLFDIKNGAAVQSIISHIHKITVAGIDQTINEFRSSLSKKASQKKVDMAQNASSEDIFKTLRKIAVKLQPAA